MRGGTTAWGSLGLASAVPMQNPTQDYSSMEFCPACGDFHHNLVELTGWCDICTVQDKWPGRLIVRCRGCERAFPAYHKPLRTENQARYASSICGTCKTRHVTLQTLAADNQAGLGV